MTTTSRAIAGFGLFVAAVGYFSNAPAAQNQQPPGHPIGTVSTKGDLIVLELDAGAIAPANLFDLAHRTLRFTPNRDGYRVQNVAVQWDADFGTAITSPLVPLHNFTFPFSGKSWDAIAIGQTGTISFGLTPSSTPAGRGGVGPAVGRFAELRDAAGTIVQHHPGHQRFPQTARVRSPLRQGAHRPRRRNLDADGVLRGRVRLLVGADGESFPGSAPQGRADRAFANQVAAQDAIVGLYPRVDTGTKRPLTTITDPDDPAAPAHLDIHNVKASVVDGLFLEIALETRSPVLAEGDAQLAGVVYRVTMNRSKRPAAGRTDDLVWTVARHDAGSGWRRRRAAICGCGPGLSPGVKIAGNMLSVIGTLPAVFKSGESIEIAVETMAPGAAGTAADAVAAQSVTLTGIRNPEVDLSALGKNDGPFTIVYESFHHAGLPRPADMACSVIEALGDRFDFLAWYSDFRVDNQEAGTPSTGPMDQSVTGFRPAGSSVGGSGRGPASFCSDGRLQSTFIQPVYIGSNQGMERSPMAA